MQKKAFLKCPGCAKEIESPQQPLAFTVVKRSTTTCAGCNTAFDYDGTKLLWRYV